MQIRPFDTPAPHYCCSCGQAGDVLCEYCKYDIISDIPVLCLACLGPVASYGAVCSGCNVGYKRGWFVAFHAGPVRELIKRFKFQRTRAGAQALADLMSAALPQVPSDIVVVPVPTVRSHVRDRGYDHAARLAKLLARQRGLKYASPLRRVNKATQRGANRAQRIKQASMAFGCRRRASGRYLLIDDVCTTGATVNYAAKALVAAGASEVWVAVASREPLN